MPVTVGGEARRTAFVSPAISLHSNPFTNKNSEQPGDAPNLYCVRISRPQISTTHPLEGAVSKRIRLTNNHNSAKALPSSAVNSFQPTGTIVPPWVTSAKSMASTGLVNYTCLDQNPVILTMTVRKIVHRMRKTRHIPYQSVPTKICSVHKCLIKDLDRESERPWYLEVDWEELVHAMCCIIHQLDYSISQFPI